MIDGITNWFCLLAARPDSARVWGRFDHQRPTFGSTGWMIVAGLVALLAAVALLSNWLSKRRQRDFWYDSSSRLFRDLCRAHRLNLANRRLMQKLASARGVDNAAALFVEPNYFDFKSLPETLKSSDGELLHLRHELFE
jgi:hypothetical protein